DIRTAKYRYLDCRAYLSSNLVDRIAHRPVCGRLVIDCRNHVTWQQSRTCSGRIWQRPYDRRMTSSIANLSSYATTYVAVQVFVELFRFLPIHVYSVVITLSCDESAACAIYQCFRVNIAVKIQL